MFILPPFLHSPESVAMKIASCRLRLDKLSSIPPHTPILAAAPTGVATPTGRQLWNNPASDSGLRVVERLVGFRTPLPFPTLRTASGQSTPLAEHRYP